MFLHGVLLSALLFTQNARANDPGQDPEVGMPGPQIIQRWGYPVEVHNVLTDDGYILTIWRIPHGKNEKGATGPKPVVFLQHGLEGSGTNWIINLPEQSAGFIYADAGLDVWIGNVRGTTYCLNHTSLDPKSKEFWAFSFDEMTKYDLTSMINYALRVSEQDDLYYVGHSQGTLMMFAKLSDDPAFHTKLRRVFALAPVATVEYIKGMLDYLAKYLYPEFEIVWDLLGSGEFLPSSWLMKTIAKWVCGENSGEWLCDDIIFLLAGPDMKSQLNRTRTAVYTSHSPAGTSTQNILHWAQQVLDGRFEKFDYRSARKNQKHYGQSSPPIYDLTNFNAPLHIYWSTSDWLADEKDIKEHLLPELNPNILKEVVELQDFSHIDFIWGLRAAKEVYAPVLRTIQADIQQRSAAVFRKSLDPST